MLLYNKTIQLRDVLAAQVAAAGEIARIDILSFLSKATLDIVGRAGFNYKFDALKGESSDLNKAFSVIFGEPQGLRFWPIAQTLIPALRSLVRNLQNKNHMLKMSFSSLLRTLLVSNKRRGQWLLSDKTYYERAKNP